MVLLLTASLVMGAGQTASHAAAPAAPAAPAVPAVPAVPAAAAKVEASKGSCGKFDQQRHAVIMAAPGRAECQIVFIGDSITEGWTKAIWDKEYAAMNGINMGVSWDITDNVLWRLEQGELDGLKALKVVVLHIGTNDIGLARRGPEAVAAGIAAVVGRIKEKAPQAKVLLMGITPKGRGNVDAANAIIAKLDDGKTVFYQNINAAVSKAGGVADRVGHLNEKGFQVWADEIRPTLAKLMK
jgi:beta-glucosidase